MFTGPIVTRLAGSDRALLEAFALLGFMIKADPFYMEPVRKFGFAALMILLDAEKVRLGTMGEYVTRDSKLFRQRYVSRNMTTLLEGFDQIADCTGVIDTIYLAARKAGGDVLEALRKMG